MARFIRNYEVFQKLGGGKFGEVFLATGETPGRGLSAGRRRVVAIKKLREHATPEAARLLQQEFDLLDQVKHRGIVRVFEFVPEEQAVVMEAVDGVTLRTVLDECGRAHEQVFTEAVVEIACELADALYQANTTPGDNGEPLRLVHRDLKPENVMLTPQGEVKILDFGLARVDNADFRKDDPNRLRGTPVYMAPEQARLKDVDHRTDLFALGLITYELLMGKPAYRVPENAADPVAAVYDAIERAALQDRVSELESKIPGMGPIIARCLQAQPKSRYQTGQELLVDLRRQLYRDRGAYLQEFCEFFFGSICEHHSLPTLESLGASSTPAPAGRSRMSIEERLKQSMEREQRAARNVPAAPAGPAAAPPPASSQPPRTTPRARSFSPPAGAAPAPLPPPRSAPAEKRPPMVGARSPNETGMLELVPLGTQGGEDGPGGDPSATAFFAIPAPKAEPAQPASPPRPAPGPAGSPGPAYGFGGAPSQGMGPGFAGPLPGSAPPMGGIAGPTSGSAGSAPVQPFIQGPVASSPGHTPFHASQPPAVAPQKKERRVASYRVFAILLAVFMLACTAVVLAVWFGAGMVKQGTPTVAAVDEPVTADAEPVKPSPKTEDTGEKPKPKPANPKPRQKNPSSPAPAPAPKPAASPGTLKVKMTDQTFLTAVEVVCTSGPRPRASITPGGSATVAGIPSGEACNLFFKGGAGARFSPVYAGQSLSCAIQGTTAVCQ